MSLGYGNFSAVIQYDGFAMANFYVRSGHSWDLAKFKESQYALDFSKFEANGQNDWDKGVGSAMTYAERYFLLKYFHIATDEDDIDNPKVDEIIIDIEACTKVDKLEEIWNKNVLLQADAKFKQAVIVRKKQLENENK